jgi:hypothetical protein
MSEQQRFVDAVREQLSWDKENPDLLEYYDKLRPDHPLKLPFTDQTVEFHTMVGLTVGWVIDDCRELPESSMRKRYGKERVPW